MSSFPVEKIDSLVNPNTSCSNASSATFYSKISLKSLRRAASSFGLLPSPKRSHDVEQQPRCVEVADDAENDAEDDGSVFAPGGPDGTKVRKRTCNVHTQLAPSSLMLNIVEQCPNGYPRVAAFNASEQNFMLYRGFSCVHARLLLNMQAGIQMLESELDTLDRDHLAFGDDTRLKSYDVDVDACEKEKKEGERTRDDVLEDLRIKVSQYDELLIKARELVAFQRPTDRDYRSVRNWHEQAAPLVGEDQEFLLWKEDIVTLRHGREWASFDGLVEEMLHKFDCPLIRVSRYQYLSSPN
jgi:hypothetical protein